MLATIDIASSSTWMNPEIDTVSTFALAENGRFLLKVPNAALEPDG